MALLHPSLLEKFSSIIWKIEIDEGSDTVAIETRDKDLHSAAFSAFDYTTGKCYFKEQSTENSWWWGLDRIHRGIVYLHGYKNEMSPEHRGIIALDAKTGKTKWQQFNYVLDSISDRGLIVNNALIQLPKPELLSPETGQSITGNVEENIATKRNIMLPENYTDLLSLPDFIPGNAVEPFLQMDHNRKSCWAFHIKNEGGFVQKLVITESKEIILSVNLAVGIQKLNPEAFFMHKNHLFCIRDNNYEIVSFLL